MMSLHGPQGAVDAGSVRAAAALPDHAVWIDLNDPTAEEAACVETKTGIRVPSRAALSEVELSSRLRRNRDGLSLSTPMVTFDRSDFSLKPLGFLLNKTHLVTVRYHDMRAFAAVRKRVDEEGGDGSTGARMFLLVVEELVDNLADLLEEMSADLDNLSTRIFDFDASARPGARKGDATAPKRRDLALRRLLRTVGRHGKSLSKVRASLLGLERIVAFAKGECGQHLDEADAPRFETVARDIASLDEFETRLSETIQFLLDATLGLINVEQNNAFRILTVVSVVGVPPTLVASMYGMNFKHMPELDWVYGYPYGLALIAISAIVPLVYFKSKGWL
ncbi:magnesium transporter CorA family protein [Methylorubrum salsuginis]|uniref:Magnesium transport protein CorA n=1 Tax=Methylorubrum salsuginis TaxID=414703 RepID=A0A1I4GMG9_9HYPH|nr:magnesium transporter CorA family protein [Methylorubrum salsuginis]SFL31165.1 magnesium transporter [Methylorubrum salsuginis]